MVGDNIEQPKVMSLREALRLADEMELDLIEISPKADPPVCRIADYQKFLYQQKKKAKELKANQTKVVVKEIRFGPQTDDHDYNFKLKHAENFLKEGAKVKAYVFFRGRSIVFKEQGEILQVTGKLNGRPGRYSRAARFFLALLHALHVFNHKSRLFPRVFLHQVQLFGLHGLNSFSKLLSSCKQLPDHFRHVTKKVCAMSSWRRANVRLSI